MVCRMLAQPPCATTLLKLVQCPHRCTHLHCQPCHQIHLEMRVLLIQFGSSQAAPSKKLKQPSQEAPTAPSSRQQMKQLQQQMTSTGAIRGGCGRCAAWWISLIRISRSTAQRTSTPMWRTSVNLLRPRLVSSQKAVTTASIRKARCACMCAHVCMRNLMHSSVFGRFARSQVS